MPELKCIVVTPETTVLDQTAEFIALPLFDGELGVAPRHSPMIGRLGYGEMRIRQGASTTSYYVDGGFVQVADDVVSVLTNRAVLAKQVDVASAEEQLTAAHARKAHTDDLFAIRERLISQARGQIRVASRSRS